MTDLAERTGEEELLNEPVRPASGRKRRQRKKYSPGRIVLMVFLIILGISFLAPTLWMLNTSLRPEEHAKDFPPGLAIWDPQWSNYAAALKGMPVYFMNSLQLAVLNVVGGVIVAALSGYAFARLTWKGRDAIFGVVLVTAIVPNIIYLLPQYLLFQQIGWIDTFFPLWVPKVLTPVFGAFLMRQAFKSLPAGLEEAAQIDGSSTFRTFLTIMLPQVRPAMAAVAMFAFLDSWNDLFGPLIFLTSPEKQTLPIGLAQFQNEFYTQVGPLMAGATLTVVPVFLIFLFAQRYFIQGVTGSGFKG